MATLRAALEKFARRRVSNALDVYMAILHNRAQRKQLAWAVRIWVLSVLVFAAACALLHLLMTMIFRR